MLLTPRPHICTYPVAFIRHAEDNRFAMSPLIHEVVLHKTKFMDIVLKSFAKICDLITLKLFDFQLAETRDFFEPSMKSRVCDLCVC